MENEYSWIRYLNNRIKKNKNFLGTITGQTGSGKSWSALSIGEMIDPEFSVDRVIFKGRELMRLINSNTLQPGSVIIWDEAGVDLSNRNWQSTTNKLLNYLLQTFRHKNFILFFTVPYNDFLDASTKKLFHADFETVSINKQQGTCRIKPKLLQYNSNLKKWYMKYLRVNSPDNGKITIRRWDIPKPSDSLIKEYEAKREEFTSGLNKEIEMKLLNIEVKEQEEVHKGAKKELTDRQKGIIECWKKGTVRPIDIARELKTNNGEISRNISRMKRKGYDKSEYI